MGTATFRSRETERAKALRRAATPAERKLWGVLGNRLCGGYKFSRQMPIGPYVVDFLCRERRLVVEIDGYSHDLSLDRDAARTAWLDEQGYEVIRFSNRDVIERLEGIVIAITSALGGLPEAHPRPLPQAGGEAAAA